MSTLLTIILVLNLCFAGGTILVILHGMYMEKTRDVLNTDNYLGPQDWKAKDRIGHFSTASAKDALLTGRS